MTANDAEIAVMAECYRLLHSLPASGQGRVMEWLTNRLETDQWADGEPEEPVVRLERLPGKADGQRSDETLRDGKLPNRLISPTTESP